VDTTASSCLRCFRLVDHEQQQIPHCVCGSPAHCGYAKYLKVSHMPFSCYGQITHTHNRPYCCTCLLSDGSYYKTKYAKRDWQDRGVDGILKLVLKTQRVRRGLDSSGSGEGSVPGCYEFGSEPLGFIENTMAS
jgi:hypothetical protein